MTETAIALSRPVSSDHVGLDDVARNGSDPPDGQPYDDLVRGFVAEIADLLGRLQSVLPDDARYACDLVARIGQRVESLDALVRLTAGERYRANIVSGCDESEALSEALAVVEGETRMIRHLLRLDQDGARQ